MPNFEAERVKLGHYLILSQIHSGGENCREIPLPRTVVIFSSGVAHFYRGFQFQATENARFIVANRLQTHKRGGDEPRIPLGD